MNLDPKEVARFIVTEARWVEHHERGMPRRYKCIRLRGVHHGIHELMTEIQKLLPSMAVSSAEVPGQLQRDVVLLADSKEIHQVKQSDVCAER